MRWRLCWCAWLLWRHSRAVRTFLIADPSPNLPLREVFLVEWVSDPSSLRVGALVELVKNDKPSARP